MMQRTLFIAALVLALLAQAAPARAQEPTRADSAAVLVGTAERLQAQGAADLAEALARLVQRRYADTPAAARAAALLGELRATQRSTSGRVGLIAASTLYGAWLGVAIPLMFEAESPEAFGLGLLAGAPLGFFAGRAYARSQSVSAGDAGLITWLGAWGTYQGAAWMNVLGESEVCPTPVPGECYDDEPEGSAIVGAAVVGGLLGIGSGVLAANRADVTGGTATMIGWGSLWGTWAGIVAAVLGDMDGDDQTLTAVLIGGDVGLVSMALLAPRWDMSAGRAWLVNAAGVMGGAIGGGIDLLLLPEDEDIAILIPAIGTGVGLGLGAYLTRDYDEGRMREGMRLDAADAPGALVRARDGDWRLAMPLPAAVLLHEKGSGRTELGVHVPLLDARF